MTYVPTLAFIAVLSSPAVAATHQPHARQQPAAATVIQVAQAKTGNAGTRTHAGAAAVGYDDQMKAMQQMHDRMLAAKTLEARNALMVEQAELMQTGMNMMAGMHGSGGSDMGMGMGANPSSDDPIGMAARQGMMDRKMDLMQSMMHMMMDRLPPIPATK